MMMMKEVAQVSVLVVVGGDGGIHKLQQQQQQQQQQDKTDRHPKYSDTFTISLLSKPIILKKCCFATLLVDYK